MLSFIPMNKTASIYKQSGEVDKWGQPILSLSYTGKCQISYSTDLLKISGEDGVMETASAILVFNGLVQVESGDLAEFTSALGTVFKNRIIAVSGFEDYAGKIIATRVVIGSGKGV